MDENSAVKRGPNFTKADQILLFTAMKDFIHIIKSTKTDTVKNSEKKLAWTKVTEIFNANSTTPRTVENIITFYRNVKSKMNKNYSEAKMLLVDTNHPVLENTKTTSPRTETEIVNKNKTEAPSCHSNCKTPELCESNSDSYKQLCEAKMELINLKKKYLKSEIKLKEMQIAAIKEESDFNEEIRTKELLLMDIKIQNEYSKNVIM